LISCNWSSRSFILS